MHPLLGETVLAVRAVPKDKTVRGRERQEDVLKTLGEAGIHET